MHAFSFPLAETRKSLEMFFPNGVGGRAYVVMGDRDVREPLPYGDRGGLQIFFIDFQFSVGVVSSKAPPPLFSISPRFVRTVSSGLLGFSVASIDRSIDLASAVFASGCVVARAGSSFTHDQMFTPTVPRQEFVGDL